MNILVVRAGALGDTLMATPVIRALGERYPDASIDVLCSVGARPLVELHPKVDRVWSLKWRNVPYALSWEKRRLVRDLRERHYDVAVLLERAARYREIVARAGVSEIRSFQETPFDRDLHATHNNLRAALVEGSTDMELVLADADRSRAEILLQGLQRPLVGLHVGYGPRGKKRDQSLRLKGWALDNFIELAERLAAAGASIVLTGSSEDMGDVEKVATRVRARDVAGKTSVRELAAVIQNLDLFISVDTGPAHMAAALKTPLVVLWGPAILEQVRPMSSSSPVTVVRHPVVCAPCYETPLMKTCQRNICMERITSTEVFETARRSLMLV